MVSSPAYGSGSPWISYLLLFLLPVASLVKSRPPPVISGNQIADGLFDTRVGSLLRNHLDLCGGPDDLAPPVCRGEQGTHMEPGMEPRNAPPGLLLDFMGRQRKFKGRTRKSGEMRGGHAGALTKPGC